ncbi:major facilitator superfamily domain-containing protein [Suillus subluteus]|nr:major facilitator superfamily domain-containing protein [Suillus subluteus]
MSPDPTSQQLDEETPLLRSEGNALAKKPQTPLPWRQFSMVLVLQIAEPMTSQVISPFAPQLIRDIGITHGDEALVSFYVGLLHSLFFATEALTIFHWSRLSDYIGRKPVLLIGLFGLSLSMFCFGLSKTFWTLVISRCLNGALNGNIGVMKSMVAEMTDSTNMARAWALLPLAWSSGATLGPLIGGGLARPADRFPNIFGSSEFLKKYPYFLPCAVPATVSALSWIVVFLYLKESQTSTPPINISQLLPWKRRAIVPSPALETPPVSSSIGDKPVPIRALFGLDTPAIGTILAVQGTANGIMQILAFAKLHDIMGAKKLWLFAMTCALPMVALFPVLNTLARFSGVVQSIWYLVALQLALTSCTNFAYGVSFIYIAAASPNRASVGATNGFAQVIVSVLRAVGPAAANSAFSISIERQYLGGNLVYCVMEQMECFALLFGFLALAASQ